MKLLLPFIAFIACTNVCLAAHFPIGIAFPNLIWKYGDAVVPFEENLVRTNAQWIRTDLRAHESPNFYAYQGDQDTFWNFTCYFHSRTPRISILGTAGPNTDDYVVNAPNFNLTYLNFTAYEEKLIQYFTKIQNNNCGQLDALEVGNELDLAKWNASDSHTFSDVYYSDDIDQLPDFVPQYAKLLKSAHKIITQFGWTTKIITFGLSGADYWLPPGNPSYPNFRLLKNPKRMFELLLAPSMGVVDLIDGFAFHPTGSKDFADNQATLLNISQTWNLPNKPYWITESYVWEFRAPAVCPNAIAGLTNLANSGLNIGGYFFYEFYDMLDDRDDITTINSTCSKVFTDWNSSGTGTTTTTGAATTGTTTTGTTTTCSNQLYDACGGSGVPASTPTCCPAGSYCNCSTQYYHQCLPGNSNSPGACPSSTSTTSGSVPSTSTTGSTPSTSTTTGDSCAPLYGQCGGGNDWTGPTCCSTGTCTVQYHPTTGVVNQYYKQCL